MNSLKTLLRKELELEKKLALLCILFVEYLIHEDFTNSDEFYERLKSYYLPQRFSWVWSFAGGVYLGGSMFYDSEIKLLRKSRKCLKKALKLKPDDFGSLYNLSEVYLKEGDKVKAKQVIKTALSIKPDNYRALLSLGDLHVINKEYSKAIDIFDKINTQELHESRTFDIWERLGICFGKVEEFEKAIVMYKAALVIKLDKWVLFELGILYDQVGDYDAAISTYKIVLKKDPNYDVVWEKLGRIYYNLHDYILAIMCFKRVIKLDNPFLHIWNELGALYVKIHQVKKAIQTYREAIDNQSRYIQREGVRYPNILYLDACEQLISLYSQTWEFSSANNFNLNITIKNHASNL